MKKLIFSLLVGFLVCPIIGLADGLSSMLNGGSTPTQSFHEVGHQAASNSALTQEQAMKKVREIMAKAKHMQEAKDTQNAKPASNTATNETVKNDDAKSNAFAQKNSQNSNAAASDQELAEQISTLNQTNLLFQQQTDQRLANLAEKNQILQEKVARLDRVMMLLNQELNQYMGRTNNLHAGLSNLNNTKIENHSGLWGSFFEDSKSAAMQYLFYAMIALLLCIIILMFAWNKRKTAKHLTVSKSNSKNASASTKMAMQNHAVDNDDDTQDEYDFMGSHEALPAKLDLARAYIAMEDYAAAQKVLDEVLSVGTDEHKQEASQLLVKISKN